MDTVPAPCPHCGRRNRLPASGPGTLCCGHSQLRQWGEQELGVAAGGSAS